MSNNQYAESVFINCPFDKEYKNLFNAIIFAVKFCGFTPRSAREQDNSGDVRIDKIISILKECKFGIHDISRTELDKKTKLPRFNMPLELGLDLGTKKSGVDEYKNKQILIIDKEQYRYQSFISDIAGQDIKSHNNNEIDIITCVREFLGNHTRKKIAHGSLIASNYAFFKSDLPSLCTASEWTINELSFNEYISLVDFWINFKK